MNIKKAVLMYFSPTGGTKKLACLLGQRLGMEIEEMDITAGEPKRTFAPDELAVFAFPCYGGRIPAPMHERMKGIKGSNTPALLLCVFGNRAVDDAYLEMKDAAAENGFVSIAAAEFIAPHSVDRSYASDRPDASDLKIMDEFAAKFREKIAAAEAPKAIELPGNRPYREYNGIPIKPGYKAKNCIHCGKCFAHCPTGAINAAEPDKFDRDKCISCMGCVAVCPEGARYIPTAMKIAGKAFLKKACSDRKEPKYFL